MDPLTLWLGYAVVTTWLVDRDYKAAQKREADEAHQQEHCPKCGWRNYRCTCSKGT